MPREVIIASILRAMPVGLPVSTVSIASATRLPRENVSALLCYLRRRGLVRTNGKHHPRAGRNEWVRSVHDHDIDRLTGSAALSAARAMRMRHAPHKPVGDGLDMMRAAMNELEDAMRGW